MRWFPTITSETAAIFSFGKNRNKKLLWSNQQSSLSSWAAAMLERSETTTTRRRSITAVDVIWFVKLKFEQFAQQLQVTCASPSLTFVCNDARVSRGDNKQTLLLFLGVHTGEGGEHIINFQMATSPASQWLSIFYSYKRHHFPKYFPGIIWLTLTKSSFPIQPSNSLMVYSIFNRLGIVAEYYFITSLINVNEICFKSTIWHVFISERLFCVCYISFIKTN